MAWVIVGLGNPGHEYERTRHNTGRLAVQRFAILTRFDAWKEEKVAKVHVAKGMHKNDIVVLLLPDTFMNKSGNAVTRFIKSPKAASRMIVVYDDLDLPIGKMKLSYDRGSGGHKGIESIARAVKTKEFARIRIGISQKTAAGTLKKPQGETSVNDFILGTFKPSEMKELDVVFDRAAVAIAAIIEKGPLVAMNEFNKN